MKGMAGLPVGVQICCLPYEDEKCLSVVNYVEKIMKSKGIGMPDEKKLLSL